MIARHRIPPDRCQSAAISHHPPVRFMRFKVTLALLSLCLLPGAVRAQPVAAAGSVEELRARLDAHLNQPRFSGALWGVKIVSLDTGRTLYEHHADRLLSPASNSKLYTAALALDRLGGDYRMITPILATARPDSAGRVRGDVIVSGRGDPSWKSGPGRKNFWEIFEPFVAALAQAGVRRIAGDIVADATYFQSRPSGAGWTVDDLNDDYGAEISAVALEDNYAELRITAAARAGQPAALALWPPLTGLVLDNRIVTTAAGGPRRIEVRRIFGENTVHAFGEIPLGGTEEMVEVTVPRPAVGSRRRSRRRSGGRASVSTARPAACAGRSHRPPERRPSRSAGFPRRRCGI